MSDRVVDKLIVTIERWISAFLFACMFGAIVVQVIWRYMLKDPLVWPFEFSVFAYIYIVFFGSVVALRKDSHVAFGLFAARFSQRGRAVVELLLSGLALFAMGIVIKPSIEYMAFLKGIDSTALSIPWSWVLFVFPASMSVMCMMYAARLIRAFGALKGGGK